MKLAHKHKVQFMGNMHCVLLALECEFERGLSKALEDHGYIENAAYIFHFIFMKV